MSPSPPSFSPAQPDQPNTIAQRSTSHSKEDGRVVDRFLVCGLGSLGQYCAYNLRRFSLAPEEVCVTAIDRQPLDDWEVHDLPALLDNLILGDCRNDDVLLRAGVKHCRAILLVTSDESVNIETAIAARRLNPSIRLVVRSSRQRLNELLKDQLGNFVALQDTELPAPAFALAGLGAGVLGFFDIGSRRLQVVEQIVQPGDVRFENRSVMALSRKQFRLLSLRTLDAQGHWSAVPTQRAFHQWLPDAVIKAGDRVAFVELLEPTTPSSHHDRREFGNPLVQLWRSGRDLFRKNLGKRLRQAWEWVQANQTRQLVGLGVIVAIVLWAFGATILHYSLKLSWQQAVSASVILLLGGYGDVFGGLEPPSIKIPWFVQFISLLITIFSLLFVLGILGLIADSLLSSRFDFWQKRLLVPKGNHVVLVGFGRVGQRVASLLQAFKQPLVVVTEHLDNTRLPQQMPMLVGNYMTELTKANLDTAKSIIVVTEDQMLNLELGLMARSVAAQANRQLELVIRTYDQRFSDNLNRLLPNVKVLSVHELSGEAFAGAAFGENILALFRLNHQTILVTEYTVGKADTMTGKHLFQVAYGYGVVPIFHQPQQQVLEGNSSNALMPSDDRRLQPGDRLIVLSTINGLRRIERGEIAPPRRWHLFAERPMNETFAYDLGNDLSRIGGCTLDEARTFISRLPGTLEVRLYDHQAQWLLQTLQRQIHATLTPLDETDLA